MYLIENGHRSYHKWYHLLYIVIKPHFLWNTFKIVRVYVSLQVLVTWRKASVSYFRFNYNEFRFIISTVVKKIKDYPMLFYHNIVAERCERYRSTGNCVCFSNRGAFLKIGVVYILKIMYKLSFFKWWNTFLTIYFCSLEHSSPKKV